MKQIRFKKPVALLLALIMVMSMLPVSAMAEEGTPGEGPAVAVTEDSAEKVAPKEETPEDIINEDCVDAETPAPKDIEALQTNAAMLDAPVNTKTIYLTVSLDGEFVKDKNGELMAQRMLAVPANDKNICTIDDIMKYAHKMYSPNGVSDYASDGAVATKLWGVDKGDKVILFNTDTVRRKSFTEAITFGSDEEEFPEHMPSFQISVSMYTDKTSARASRIGAPKQNQGVGSARFGTKAVVMKDTPLTVNLISVGPSDLAYDVLTGYQAVAYTMDGVRLGPDKFEGTVSTGKFSKMTAKFAETGVYVLSAVPTDKATITASPSACIVTVIDEQLEYNEFKLYANQEKTYLLNVSKENSGYTVEVPENVNILYPVFSLAGTVDSLSWFPANLKNGVWVSTLSDSVNSFGDSSTIGLMNSNREAVDQLRICLANGWQPGVSIQHCSLQIKRLPVLDSLSVKGYEKDAFDPTGGKPYPVYITPEQSTVAITPVTKDVACTVMVNGVSGASGETFNVPVSKLNFDADNKAEVLVGVHSENTKYVDNTYTVILEKQPQGDMPAILMQPEGAEYITGVEATPISLYASANGPLTYQWYCSETDSNTGGKQIDDAVNVTFTPSTVAASTLYYYCEVINMEKNASIASNAVRVVVDNPINIAMEWSVDVPNVEKNQLNLFNGETKGFYYKQGATDAEWLAFTATCDDAGDGGDWSYLWTIREGTSTKIEETSYPEYMLSTSEAYGLCSYSVKAQYKNAKGVTYTSSLPPIYVYVDKVEIDYSEVNLALEGTGTKIDPWKIKDQSDFCQIQKFVAQGKSFEDRHFVMTKDITLDKTWDSIGKLKSGTTITDNGINIYPFSGTIDGGGKTLTYADGTSKPLFRYVREATVRNLNIYAPNFKGLLLVSDYVVDYGSDGDYGIGVGGSYAPGCPDTIDIENITVKSGTWVSGGSFIDGGASGGNTVNIRNCVIEPGVTMGKDRNTEILSGNVASFAGRISGTVVNCVSSADLYSSETASGIVSGKSQSMGPFLVLNCGFLGSITAGGGYVGGIMGKGYEAESAPNTPCISIQNCYVGATLRGSGKIGGIFGGEPYNAQTWNPAFIRNNVFFGKIEAAGDNAIVGGIVGYMYALNKNNVVGNNFYSADCGAQRPIGNGRYVDTSAAHETSLGISYFTTSGGKSADLPFVGGYNPAPKTNMNRTDDPFGKDAAKLGKPVTETELANGSVVALLNKGEGSLKNWVQSKSYPTLSDTPVAYKLDISGDYKTEYTIGDSLDMSGARFTATWSDGSVTTPAPGDIKITGYDSSQRAVLTLTATYGAAETQFVVIVLKPVTSTPGGKDSISVSFVLLGDDHHESDVDGNVHTLKNGGLTPWLEETRYEVGINATVETVFRKALEEAGIRWEGTANNQFKTLYISGVQNPVTKKILSEFDNGPLSGWMYTLNGTHPDVGIAAKFVNDGDRIIFHYTDDYTKEEGSEGWSGGAGIADNKETTITPSVTASNGKAEVSIKESELTAAISSAKKNGGAITIAPTVKGSASKIAVEVPKVSVANVASDTKSDLKVRTDLGSIIIPNDVLAVVAAQATGSAVTISIEAVEAKELTAEQQKTVGDGKVFDVTITSGDKAVSSFGGKRIAVSLPYTLKTGENAVGVAVWYLNDTGKLERVACTYDKATGLATFTTTHLSKYVVGYDRWSNPFTDVSTADWFYDAVRYAAQKELFRGTSATAFGPSADMTRAMLVTGLYRMEGKPAVTAANAFVDVKPGQWYTDAVSWASANKIVEGYGNGIFGTTNIITREQIAAILYRYAKFKGYDVTKTTELAGFTDASAVGSWAFSAMKWANAEGLITGTTDKTLMPTGTASRAQVATIFMRFMEKVMK